jgi:uridine kinase
MATNRIKIICKNNGKSIEVPFGTTISEAQLLLQVQTESPIVGALINNKPACLHSGLYNNKTIEFIEQNSSIGKRIYVRSLVFLLYKAIQDTYPQARFRVEYAISTATIAPSPSTKSAYPPNNWKISKTAPHNW